MSSDRRTPQKQAYFTNNKDIQFGATFKIISELCICQAEEPATEINLVCQFSYNCLEHTKCPLQTVVNTSTIVQYVTTMLVEENPAF